MRRRIRWVLYLLCTAAVSGCAHVIANNDHLHIIDVFNPAIIPVLENDTTAGGPFNPAGELLVTNVGAPVHGKANIYGDHKQILYNPPIDYAGTDQFTYETTDSKTQAKATGMVEVTVEPSGGIKVRVLLAGKDRLSIRGNVLQWHHYAGAAPGNYTAPGFRPPGQATRIFDQFWHPWPTTDTYYDYAKSHGSPLDSEEFQAAAGIPLLECTVTVQPARNPDGSKILEQTGTSDNDFTTILYAYDKPNPRWQIDINYTACRNP